MAGGCVAFVHAHPDDEAIFTGGTMARLAAAGVRVVLVVATRGEIGGDPSVREAETRVAAKSLGVTHTTFLGYTDSGLDATAPPPGSFAAAEVDEAVDRLAAVLEAEQPAALVSYDEVGIYGHPDHVQAHRVAHRSATVLGVPSVYDATVDREYLHFVETHLVHEAGGDAVTTGAVHEEAGALGLAALPVGVPTVMVDLTVDVRSALGSKRAAMIAHASQIPETASAMRLDSDGFAAVYGFEWYLRRGEPGPLDALA